MRAALHGEDPRRLIKEEGGVDEGGLNFIRVAEGTQRAMNCLP